LQIIFITYINRSGSTFLLNQLSKFKGVLALPEGEILVEKLLRYPQQLANINLNELFQSDFKLLSWNLSKKDINDINTQAKNIEVFFNVLNKYRDVNCPESDILLFKAYEFIHMDNLFKRDIQDKYNFEIIAIIRDIRGIFASQKNNYYRGRGLENNPFSAVKKWNDFIRNYQKFANDLIPVQYESLILNFENVFKNLLIKINPEFEKRGKIEYKTVSDIIPPSQKNLHPFIDLPPIKAKVDQWKNELKKDEIFIIEYYGGRSLKSLGYLFENPEVNKLKIYISIILLRMKHLYVTLFRKKFN
jgi:hypothetical protein